MSIAGCDLCQLPVHGLDQQIQENSNIEMPCCTNHDGAGGGRPFLGFLKHAMPSLSLGKSAVSTSRRVGNVV